MRAEIITIGTELLLGAIDDTNATYIARALNAIGIDVLYRTTVGDNEERITQVIRHGLTRSDVVITSGGLGPTVDDVTRESIAKAAGRQLIYHQTLFDSIAERFAKRGFTMSENNRRQAFAPEGAVLIDNPVGTAPIFILETEQGVVTCLPGVPREMRYLLDQHLVPWLRTYMGETAIIHYKTLRTAGIGESHIDHVLADLMTLSNPTVGLAAHIGQTDIRITAKAPDMAAAEALILPVEDIIRERLGAWIYGTDKQGIDEVALELLNARGLTLALAEFNTGGLAAERTKAASQNVLLGSEELPPPYQRGDARSVAQASAANIRDRFNADFGAALIIYDPGPTDAAADAALAITGPHGGEVRAYQWDRERTDAAQWLSSHLFASLRKIVLEQEGVVMKPVL